MVVSSVIRDHKGNWIVGLTHFDNGGDAFLAEFMRAIQLGLPLR